MKVIVNARHIPLIPQICIKVLDIKYIMISYNYVFLEKYSKKILGILGATIGGI